MVIEAMAPSRVDLAGGTLDIYPLYLFEGGGVTVNMGVVVNSRVRLEVREDEWVHIYSEDLGLRVEAVDVGSLPLGGPLDFIVRIVKFYAPGGVGLNITTRNEASKGSGLGASSSLLIALSGVLNKLRGEPYTYEQIIDISANLEAQSLRVPTGKQDYYAALYGGVNAIWFEVAGNRLERLVKKEDEFRALEERLVLCYTGISRLSGGVNWEKVKGYIDGRERTVRSVGRIKAIALAMCECLLNCDWVRLGEVLAQEWENRKELTEGVSTPAVEELMSAAKAAGAIASKLCGAGGGGCMLSLVELGRREVVCQALAQAGAEIMDFKIARQGLVVKSDNL